MLSLRTLTALLTSALIATASGLLFASTAHAQSAEDLEVLRVDLPLTKESFRNGELEISRLIADNTYIDVEEFNLRAVELEAHTNRDGEVRLKVGRYVTPPVPLPGESDTGLLRIEAPHKTNQNWRLIIEDRVTIRSLTAVLEPRHDNPSYYQSRYEQRGYTFGNDPYLRNDGRFQSRSDNWPYSWLRSDYNYNRRGSHWLWLNDRRSRFQLNPSFGYNHIHNRNCYDRFGRHLAFGGQIRSPGISYNNRARTERRRNYLYERKNQPRSRTDRGRTNSERAIDHRAPIRTPIQTQRGSQPRAAINRAEQQREQILLQQRAQQQRAQQQRAQQQRAQAQRAQQERQRTMRSDRRSKQRTDRGSTRRETQRQGNRRGVE